MVGNGCCTNCLISSKGTKMIKKAKKKSAVSGKIETANSITYMVQDLLDGLSSGKTFKFKDFEKKILGLLKKMD